MNLTLNEQTSLAILPKVPALASACGSLYILIDILVLEPRKLSRVYHRLLLLSAASQFVESSWKFASTWPMPRDTPGVTFPLGTMGSCAAQGLFVQLGLMSNLLMFCLSVYYVLILRHFWTEEQVKRHAEPWFHVVSLFLAVSTGIAGLTLKVFNSSSLWCWIAPFPRWCTSGKEASCVRGARAVLLRWILHDAELFFCVLGMIVCIFSVYVTILQLEWGHQQYLKQNRRPCRRNITLTKFCSLQPASASRHLVSQAAWYAGVLFFTLIFGTVSRLAQQDGKSSYFPLLVMEAVFEPLDGFLVFLVYIRPSFLRWRSLRNQDGSSGFFARLYYALLLDEERRRSLKDLGYVDDYHEVEESAKKQLARYRMTRHSPAVMKMPEFSTDITSSEITTDLSLMEGRKLKGPLFDGRESTDDLDREEIASEGEDASSADNPCGNEEELSAVDEELGKTSSGRGVELLRADSLAALLKHSPNFEALLPFVELSTSYVSQNSSSEASLERDTSGPNEVGMQVPSSSRSCFESCSEGSDAVSEDESTEDESGKYTCEPDDRSDPSTEN